MCKSFLFLSAIILSYIAHIYQYKIILGLEVIEILFRYFSYILLKHDKIIFCRSSKNIINDIKNKDVSYLKGHKFI